MFIKMLIEQAERHPTEQIEAAMFKVAKPNMNEIEEEVIHVLALVYSARVSKEKFKETMKLLWDRVDSGNYCQ
jgi:hypothetical protein